MPQWNEGFRLRHANITTTMNIYTRALTPAKRKAQSKAVDVLFNRIPNKW
jgi:integrase